MNAPGWARDPIRAAGGRRAYHAARRVQAENRRAQMRSLLDAEGIDSLARGTTAALARRFGVSDTTAARDLRALYSISDRPGCPTCGARALTDAGLAAVGEATC